MFILAFNEFLVSLILVDARTVTLPVLVYNSIRSVITPDLAAVSVVYIVIAVLGDLAARPAGRAGNLPQVEMTSETAVPAEPRVISFHVLAELEPRPPRRADASAPRPTSALSGQGGPDHRGGAHRGRCCARRASPRRSSTRATSSPTQSAATPGGLRRGPPPWIPR
jgi:hypothetical protein